MYLVIGATGNVGSQVVHHLVEGDREVRAMVRDRTRAGSLPASIDIAVGDLTEAASLTAAAEGIEAVFFMQTDPDPAQASSMLAAARAGGVQRMVVLSSLGAVLHPLPIIGARIGARDEVFRDCGIPVTYLRANGLMSNALWWADSITSRGRVTDATYPGKLGIVDPYDVALVATAALTQPGHEDRGYVLTGPEALDAKQQVQILADVLDRPIDFEPQTPEQAEQAATAHGIDPRMAAAMRDLNELFAASRAGIITDDVRNLTGTAPRTFRTWCQEHQDRFTDQADS